MIKLHTYHLFKARLTAENEIVEKTAVPIMMQHLTLSSSTDENAKTYIKTDEFGRRTLIPAKEEVKDIDYFYGLPTGNRNLHLLTKSMVTSALLEYDPNF